jgi:hypothetical protein
MEVNMTCIICKKNEEDLGRINSREILNIGKIRPIIEDKIKETEDKIRQIEKANKTQELELRDKKTDKDCPGKPGEHCRNCDCAESVDDENNLWCKTYKKVFDITDENVQKELKKLKYFQKSLGKEMEILELKKNEFENLKMVEIIIENDDEYTKIMSKYLSDFSEDCKETKVYICTKCDVILNKIIENKIDEQMDGIVEMVRDEIDGE